MMVLVFFEDTLVLNVVFLIKACSCPAKLCSSLYQLALWRLIRISFLPQVYQVASSIQHSYDYWIPSPKSPHLETMFHALVTLKSPAPSHEGGVGKSETGARRAWRKAYRSVGFNKGYNFPLCEFPHPKTSE
jgi:hypothetical protein